MKTHSVISFLVFTCFLVIGYTFSIRFYEPGGSILLGSVNAVTSENQNTIDTLKNGQRSILLINTGSMNSLAPKLESIWLATYFTSDTNIQLLPIFSAGRNSRSDFEQQLERSFSLNKQDNNFVLNPDFVNVLEQHNYWWSGYILFDEVSLVKIFDLFGGIELNGQLLSGTQAVNWLNDALENPQKAYSSQIAILQSLCTKLSQAKPSSNVPQLISLLDNHILTNLDSSQLQMELDTLHSNNHNPTCRFPTLEVSRIEP